MNKCNLCPRNCNIDRESGQIGACGVSDDILIASYQLHFWEEPCLSFKLGSGAIFFSGCSLKCVYCQNYEISTKNLGQKISVKELSDIFKHFDKTADNINLVTPTHYSKQIIKALQIYKPKIPIIYNTHSFEKVEIIEKMSQYVDIFLADFKYFDDELSQKYSNVKYFDVATRAIAKMIELKPNKFEDGKMLCGVIIRHLILPNHIDDSKKVLKYISDNFPSAIVSIMAQYLPCGRASQYSELNRRITQKEYEEVIDYAYSLGIDGYAQDLSSASEDFIPSFSSKIDLPKE